MLKCMFFRVAGARIEVETVWWNVILLLMMLLLLSQTSMKLPPGHRIHCLLSIHKVARLCRSSAFHERGIRLLVSVLSLKMKSHSSLLWESIPLKNAFSCGMERNAAEFVSKSVTFSAVYFILCRTSGSDSQMSALSERRTRHSFPWQPSAAKTCSLNTFGRCQRPTVCQMEHLLLESEEFTSWHSRLNNHYSEDFVSKEEASQKRKGGSGKGKNGCTSSPAGTIGRMKKVVKTRHRGKK